MTIGSVGDCGKLETHAFCVFELITTVLLRYKGNKTGYKTIIIKISGILGEMPTIMEALEFKYEKEKWSSCWASPFQ